MAFGMTELGKLPREAQEEILSKLSVNDVCPIEIDDEVYYIPTAVNELIDHLYHQICRLKYDGIPEDTQ